MDRESRRIAVVLVGFLIEGSLAGVALMLGGLFGRSPLEEYRWDPGDALVGVAATFPLLGLLIICLRSRLGPLVRIRRVVDELIRPLLGGCSLGELALLSVAAGFGEEVLFRGLIQGSLSTRLGLGPALAITGAVFGLMHAITPGYVVLAALMGVYLGWTWAVSGNLLVPIVAHGLYDFLALAIVLRTPTGGGANGDLSDGPEDRPG